MISTVELPTLEGFLTGWFGSPRRPATAVSQPDGIEAEDGRAVFWHEAHGGWQWAYGDGDDPQVYDRETDRGRPWHATGMRLSGFWVQVAMSEAVLAPMGAVEQPAWPFPPPSMQFYVGTGLRAMARGHDDLIDGYGIFVAGHNAAAVRYLAGLGIDWDWCSWEPSA